MLSCCNENKVLKGLLGRLRNKLGTIKTISFWVVYVFDFATQRGGVYTFTRK